MAATFVDALADAIIHRLTFDDTWRLSAASPHGAMRGRADSRRQASAVLPLGPYGVERVASAVVGRLAAVDHRQELPLEAIEI